MTQISREDVQHLAQLSSLWLSQSEIDALQADLDHTITYVHRLAELNTDGVEPTYQVTDLENVWRDDVIVDYGVTRETLLALAPEQATHSVKVPKVL